jgi:hypothetical protein
MKRQILIPALCMVVLLLAQTYSIQAQIVKRGQAGFRFLENPISAEAIGRGGLGVALMNNSNSVFWNPAGLGWISGIDVSFNYTKGIADINHSSAAVGIPVGNFGVLALSGIFMDYGDFYGTRRASNDAGYEETGTFSPAAMAFGLAFSQRVTDRFSYGVHLKYAHQDLGSAWVSTSDVGLGNPDFSIEQRNYSMGVPAVDIGAYYDFMVYGIRFGAVVQNISREIEYEIEDFPCRSLFRSVQRWNRCFSLRIRGRRQIWFLQSNPAIRGILGRTSSSEPNIVSRIFLSSGQATWTDSMNADSPPVPASCSNLRVSVSG